MGRSSDEGQCSALLESGTPTVGDNCTTVTYAGVRSDGKTLLQAYPVGVTTVALSTSSNFFGATFEPIAPQRARRRLESAALRG